MASAAHAGRARYRWDDALGAIDEARQIEAMVVELRGAVRGRPVKRCPCGELVEDHVRYHWGDELDAGHYVEPPPPGELEHPSGDPPRSPEGSGRSGQSRGIPGDTETPLRWAVIDLLRTLGYTAHNLEQGYRPGSGHTRVAKGLPDVYVHGHGRRAWIECKVGRRTQTDDQRAFEAAELAAGGAYLLVRDVADVVRWHERGG